MQRLGSLLIKAKTSPFINNFQRAMTSFLDTNKLKIALCQFNVGSVKEDNILRAAKAIDEAKAANLVVSVYNAMAVIFQF